jgi:hypothetical protein
VFEQFLSVADADRATQGFRKLRRNNVRAWALTGGFAVELHRLRLGCEPSIRTLNDLDFVVPSFDCIPETLASDFLCRHIHPFDPPGKTLAQLIDADHKLRIDVFRGYGGMLSRTVPVQLPFAVIQVISPEDLIARLARIVLQITEGTPVVSKYADDLVRLLEVFNPAEVEPAWLDHRLPKYPLDFQHACHLVFESIKSHQQLLVSPEYSTRTDEECVRCVPKGRFQLVDAEKMVSIMGYC